MLNLYQRCERLYKHVGEIFPIIPRIQHRKRWAVIREGFTHECSNFAISIIAGLHSLSFHAIQIRMLSAPGCKFHPICLTGIVKISIHKGIRAHYMSPFFIWVACLWIVTIIFIECLILQLSNSSLSWHTPRSLPYAESRVAAEDPSLKGTTEIVNWPC